MTQALNRQVELAAVIESKLTVAPSDVRRDLLSEIVKVRAEVEAANAHYEDVIGMMSHELKRDRWTFTDQIERAKVVDERIQRLEDAKSKVKDTVDD